MLTDAPEVVVCLSTEVRISLLTGDLIAKTGHGPDRLLLAGLGPLRSASRADEDAVLLETVSGERWLIRMSPISGLVSTVEPATGICSAPTGSDRCATVT